MSLKIIARILIFGGLIGVLFCNYKLHKILDQERALLQRAK